MTKAVAKKGEAELLGDSGRIYIPGVNALGPLEKTIMDYIWAHGEATVPEVHKALRNQGKDLAYNTVMMTTTRLASKGYLSQDRSEVMFRYTPALTKAQYREGLVARIMDALVEVDPEAVIRHLAGKSSG